MDCCIDADAPLDYATIQIYPSQNRYEVFVCGHDEVEKLAIGLLKQLLPHLPGVNNLHSKGSNANFKLQVAGLNNTTWFTKSTLNRFFKIIASLDLVNSRKHIEEQMSQLEEARKFHLSLYAQEEEGRFESGETDGCITAETILTPKTEAKIASTDTSKDELLRAMDLRLTALRMELAAALNQATGLTCSPKDIINLIEFCDHFGSADLKNSLCKFLELGHESETSAPINDDKCLFTCMSSSDNANKANGDAQISRSTHSQTPVKYGVSPAKVAQVERQSSTHSDDSSDENQISAERNRAFSRSAQPRRSASPMRRIQIGRTGSRRAPALTIKSLGPYPGREKNLYHRDIAANRSEDEGSQEISNQSENSVRRMSVQDAINLFESKQKHQSADAQKRSSSSNLSLSTNKSVLKRWSAGTIECSAPCQPEVISEDSVPLTCDAVMNQKNSNNLMGEKLESDFTSGDEISFETNVDLKGSEKIESDLVDMEIVTVSAEWSQQKGVELNQMLMKMMESQHVRTRKPQSSKNHNVPSEHRGGFYDHYKEKRDEKLRGENARQKAEKNARFRAMQKILDDRKAELATRSVKAVGKKHPSPAQISLKIPSQPVHPRNESPKASVVRKISSKASTLPTTRKSWPSMPSGRVVGSSPSKTPSGISSAGTKPTLQKSQSTPSLPQSTAKVERSQPRNRIVRESQSSADRSLKVMKEKHHTLKKTEKAKETKVAAAAGDCSGAVMSKPSLYNKMTKKGSVVPLESRPFLRKGSRVASITGKSKHSSLLEETSTNCGNMIETMDHEVAVNTSNPGINHQHQDVISTDDANAAREPETVVNSCENCDESNNINTHADDSNNSFKEVESSAKIQSQEEPVISPIAWEEIDENQNMHNSYEDGTSQLVSPVHVAPLGLSTPRFRHSLSQMLQEESSEADTVEWGNAENPPAIVYQKDAPKGLKRLLKFARKSKGDADLTGWSSPSVFYEGEDDAEESKAVSKRNTNNLLKKAALHSKNYEPQNSSFLVGHEKNIDAHELHPAQSNLNKFEVQSSHKLNKGKLSTAASTTKASRSFFSLSAFRGSKPNETKFH